MFILKKKFGSLPSSLEEEKRGDLIFSFVSACSIVCTPLIDFCSLVTLHNLIDQDLHVRSVSITYSFKVLRNLNFFIVQFNQLITCKLQVVIPAHSFLEIKKAIVFYLHSCSPVFLTYCSAAQ